MTIEIKIKNNRTEVEMTGINPTGESRFKQIFFPETELYFKLEDIIEGIIEKYTRDNFVDGTTVYNKKQI